MFLSYYGFEEQPFGVTPDARYLYMSASNREALASLQYGIQTGRGFLALIAPPGTGKTTLLFRLMEQLQQSSRTAFLFQTQGNSAEFLANLVADLGLTPAHGDLSKLQSQLNEILLREAQLGRQFVLIIDEAQNLQDDVLETVRMLSNFETPSDKLVQIVLAGQPPLADKLAKAEMTQIRQRVSVITHLAPLSPVDAIHYIDNRLRVAGYKGRGPLFTPDAMRMLLDRGEGVPRNINNICFHALSLGYAKRQKTIDASTMAEVLADLELESLGSAVPGTGQHQSVPEGAPAVIPPRTTTAQREPSYQSANPWYKADPSGLPMKHPLFRRRTNWLVWTCVLFALAMGYGFILKRAGGESRNFTQAFYYFRHNFFSSKSLPETSSEPGQQASAHPNTNSVFSASLGHSPQHPGLPAATPMPSAPGSTQPGEIAAPASQQSYIPNTPTKGDMPIDPQGYDVGDSSSGSATNALPGNTPATGTSTDGNPSDFTPVKHSEPSVNHNFGELVMEANVDGARVFINGKSQPEWVTPHTFLLQPGTYWIEVTKYGHSSWYGSLHISKGRTRWAVASLDRASGAILIETDPSRIPVFIDGEAYGPSPVESSLSAGPHTYKVIPQNGSEPYTGSFVLKPTDILRITVKWPASGQPGVGGMPGHFEVQSAGIPAKGGRLEQKF